MSTINPQLGFVQYKKELNKYIVKFNELRKVILEKIKAKKENLEIFQKSEDERLDALLWFFPERLHLFKQSHFERFIDPEYKEEIEKLKKILHDYHKVKNKEKEFVKHRQDENKKIVENPKQKENEIRKILLEHFLNMFKQMPDYNENKLMYIENQRFPVLFGRLPVVVSATYYKKQNATKETIKLMLCLSGRFVSLESVVADLKRIEENSNERNKKRFANLKGKAYNNK